MQTMKIILSICRSPRCRALFSTSLYSCIRQMGKMYYFLRPRLYSCEHAFLVRDGPDTSYNILLIFLSLDFVKEATYVMPGMPFFVVK